MLPLTDWCKQVGPPSCPSIHQNQPVEVVSFSWLGLLAEGGGGGVLADSCERSHLSCRALLRMGTVFRGSVCRGLISPGDIQGLPV